MISSAWLDLIGLAASAHEQPPDLRPVLLRVHTDLFVTAPVRDEDTIEAFEALMRGLLPGVDDLTAIRLARKLAPCPDVPHAVLMLLASRGGEVLRLLIEDLPELPTELYEEALTGEDEIAEGFAQRSDLSSADIHHLLGRASPAIDFALAVNRALQLDAEAIDILLVRSRSHAALAQALLARSDLSAGDEAALYLHADPPRRQAIRARLGEAFAVRHMPLLRDRDAAQDMEDLAAARDLQVFADRLAEALGLPHTPVWQFEHPARHELLALALVAAGVPVETCIRIFLTLTPAISHSVQAVFAIAEVARSVPRNVATMLVEAILGVSAGLTPAGRHQPVASAAEGESRAAVHRNPGQPKAAGVPRRALG